VGAAAESVFTFLLKYPPRLFERGDVVLAPVVPAPLLALAFVAALLLIVLTYRRLRGVRPLDQTLLGGWRALSIAIVLACLLRPMLVLSTAVAQRNVLAILLDDSRSMRLADVDDESRTSAMQRTFSDSGALMRGLSSKFAVRVFRFAADVAPLAGPSGLTASGSRTDLAAALDGVREELAGMPLAGVIVATDGADNGGGDLAASLLALETRRVPVHTVGIGEERFARDLAVAEVSAPTSVLAGSTVLLDAAIGVRGAGGERTTLSVEANGRIVATEEVHIPDRGDVVRTRLRVPPMPPGTYQLSVRARALNGERVSDNNVFHTMLEVRSGPVRVLYLEGEPRPEFAFLRRAVAADSALQVVGLVRTAEHKFLRLGVRDSMELLGGFPSRREELFQYRAVVLGSIESSYFTGEQLRMLSDFVSRRGGTLLALGGRAALSEGGFAETPMAEALPVSLTRARGDTGAMPVELAVRPTAAGRLHAALRLRDGDASSAARWDSLRPLTSVNQLGALRSGATALLTGRATGNERAEEVPLLAFQRYGRGMGVVFGVQDTWLWQMDPTTPVSDATHATLWRQLMRWMVEGVPEPVEVVASPVRVGPGEPVTLRARVVDSTFVAVSGAAVVARVTTPTGAIVEVPMERSLREEGMYTARYVAPERGSYALVAVARVGRDTLRSAPGALLADGQGADVEQAELRAPLLRRIADETGGRYYPLADANRLVDDVTYTESGVTQRDARDLWDAPVVFLALVLLLGLEWAWRRRRGLA
jgi:uncharacterized membrane protein